MKKFTLSAIVAILVLGTNLNAGDPTLKPSSVTLMGGYSISTDDSILKNNHTYSFRFTQNDFGIDNFGLNAFQLALDYTPDINYKKSKEVTSSVKFGPNLIWYLSDMSDITPYLLFGLGIENLSNPQQGFTSWDFYANGGAGFEYQLRDDISLVGEAKYSYSDPRRKSTTVSAGLKFSFGNY